MKTFIHQVLIECPLIECLPCARNYRALGYREEDSVVEETDECTVRIQNMQWQEKYRKPESTEDECLIQPWGIKRVLDLCVLWRNLDLILKGLKLRNDKN